MGFARYVGLTARICQLTQSPAKSQQPCGGGGMELGLKDKVALVTGWRRGIGRGIALALAEEGCDLPLTGTDEAALREVAAAVAALGRKAQSKAIDLRKDDGAAALIDTARSAYGRLDLLVNNAGTTKRGDFLTL